MLTYNDKVVWITGASSGIGEALAYAFAARGAKLVLSARREDELVRVKQNCKLSEENILIIPFDLADTSAIDSLTEKIITRFGKIDILVNNGGISQRSFAKDTPIIIDRKIMEVNFFGTIAITKSVLPFMLKQNNGHIIVISSISGKFGFFLRSAYSASKHALQGFFESLRMEVYKDNIRVTIVCPGKIKTNIALNAMTEKGQKHGLNDNEERETTAEECAHQIMRGIKNNKEDIFIGGKEMKALWVKRFFPTLFTKIIRKEKIR